MEGFILSLVALIGLCYIVELFLAKPIWTEVAGGFVPRLTSESLYVAIGIIGATVMPHNLYLHSALVQTRSVRRTYQSIKGAIRFNLIDSVVALNGAFFINAAILILAGSVFYKHGMVVDNLGKAHELLAPLLGTGLASIAFALALLAAGQSSTLTGTLAGQIVMEGFLQFKMRPWLRRLITRLIAIVPAVITIYVLKDAGSYKLLILSQVILSLQLPFAIIPLVWFTSSRKLMGDFASNTFIKITAVLIAAVIIGLNGKLVFSIVGESLQGGHILMWMIVVPILGFLMVLLVWLIVWPMFGKKKAEENLKGPVDLDITLNPEEQKYERIGVALELSSADRVVLETTVTIAKQYGAAITLMHVVEGIGGQVHGSDAHDMESRHDEQYVSAMAEKLKKEYSLKMEYTLGYGNPAKEIVRMTEKFDLDLLIMGSHQHGGIMDLLMGQTISSVRHNVRIPVLVVPMWKDT
jgi:manganese transport protein